MTTKDKNTNGTEVESKKKPRKDGYKHVGGDVPEELYKRFQEYNAKSVRPINLSRLIENAMRSELEKQ